MVGLLRLPGLMDAHVHFRTPGSTHKEDFDSGTAAALAGGFATVLDMPNTTPPTVDEESWNERVALARRQVRCDVGLFLGASDRTPAVAMRLAAQTAGLKMYLGHTYGPLFLNSMGSVLDICRAWPGPRPIAVHADGFILAAAIALGQATGRRIHCCHVSRREEILLIKAAKERGAAISCEVTPHHLFLDESDAVALGPFGSMKPTLATSADVQALWDNLDAVDMIASDHAPHTREEKSGPNPPPGVPGLETTLPLMLTAVNEGRLSMERLVELLSTGPRHVFGAEARDATYVEVDPRTEWAIDEAALHTRCGWTPFAGRKVRGSVVRVVIAGRPAFEDGRVLRAPGAGRVLWS